VCLGDKVPSVELRESLGIELATKGVKRNLYMGWMVREVKKDRGWYGIRWWRRIYARLGKMEKTGVRINQQFTFIRGKNGHKYSCCIL